MGLFDSLKKDIEFSDYDEMEEYAGTKLDPRFKDFIDRYGGTAVSYNIDKIVSNYIQDLLYEYYSDILHYTLLTKEEILRENGIHRRIIKDNDYCIAFANVYNDSGHVLDKMSLWIATSSTTNWKAGTILISETVNSDYPEDSYVFANSFDELIRNSKLIASSVPEEKKDLLQEQYVIVLEGAGILAKNLRHSKEVTQLVDKITDLIQHMPPAEAGRTPEIINKVANYFKDLQSIVYASYMEISNQLAYDDKRNEKVEKLQNQMMEFSYKWTNVAHQFNIKKELPKLCKHTLEFFQKVFNKKIHITEYWWYNPETDDVINDKSDVEYKKKFHNQTYCEIDELILPLIRICNQKGYKTQFCCAGHTPYQMPPNKNKSTVDQTATPYILFTGHIEFKNLPDMWKIEYSNYPKFGPRTCLRYKKFSSLSYDAPGLKQLDLYQDYLNAIKALAKYINNLPDRKEVNNND